MAYPSRIQETRAWLEGVPDRAASFRRMLTTELPLDPDTGELRKIADLALSRVEEVYSFRNTLQAWSHPRSPSFLYRFNPDESRWACGRVAKNTGVTCIVGLFVPAEGNFNCEGEHAVSYGPGISEGLLGIWDRSFTCDKPRGLYTATDSFPGALFIPRIRLWAGWVNGALPEK